MSTFDTNTKIESITDHETGEKIKNIIQKYLFELVNEELLDKIMEDIKADFGEDHPAKVSFDDETHELEIIVRDRNGRFIKGSSLTLFPEKYL